MYELSHIAEYMTQGKDKYRSLRFPKRCFAQLFRVLPLAIPSLIFFQSLKAKGATAIAPKQKRIAVKAIGPICSIATF